MSMQTVNWANGSHTIESGERGFHESEHTENQSQKLNQPLRRIQCMHAVRRLREQYIRDRIRMARNADTACQLYLALAARAKTDEDRALYQRLAETEQRNLFRHTMRLKKIGKQLPRFRRTWLDKSWQNFLAACGPAYVQRWLNLLRRNESRRQVDLVRRQARRRRARIMTEA